MSLKAIEMQVALPRTLDAGKIQEQLQQRGQHMMEHANEAVKKDVENKRTSVMKSEHSAEAKLLQDGKKQNHKNQKGNFGPTPEEEKDKEHHPYKGTVIDYSG
jgi:hypothetical protein